MDWQGIWDKIVNFFGANVWNIVGFFITLFAGLIIVKLIVRLTRRLLARTRIEALGQNFLLGFIKLLLYLVLVLLLLRVIGIEITGIITTLSALVLAVGLALENNIANIANGIVIATTRVFKQGDFISVAGMEGSVTKISFLFTTINTMDNKKIIIPNSTIVNNALTNYGANGTRRVDFTFSVAYESDVELVKKTVIAVMESNGNVLLDDTHKAFCRLKTMNASSLDFFANCWCDSADYWDVYYYIMENVYNEFKRNGISVPFNQVEVRERKDEVVYPVIGDGLPERVEKKRDLPASKFNIETDSFRDAISHVDFNKYKLDVVKWVKDKKAKKPREKKEEKNKD